MSNSRALFEVLTAGLPGPRLYVLRRRLHHGMVGCWLIFMGLGLILHDWKDRPWLRD